MPSLIPFDPEVNEAQDVFGIGEPSTEYLTTIVLEDGSALVAPSIWWSKDGSPRFLGDAETQTPFEDAVRTMVEKYEEETGLMFPRFNSIEEADKFAVNRSKAGGATKGSILVEPEKVSK